MQAEQPAVGEPAQHTIPNAGSVLAFAEEQVS